MSGPGLCSAPLNGSGAWGQTPGVWEGNVLDPLASWNHVGIVGHSPPPAPWYSDADCILAASILILVAIFATALVHELRRNAARPRHAGAAQQIRAAAEEVLDAMEIHLVGDHREAALQVIRVYILDVDITEDGWFEHLREVVEREKEPQRFAPPASGTGAKR